MHVKKDFQTILLLCLFLSTLFVLTFFPYEFSTYWLNKFVGWGPVAVMRALFTIDPTDLIQNIAAFLPLGWILFALKMNPGRKTGGLWFLLPLSAGLATSLVVETVQLFLPRQASAVDLLANGAGAVFGFFTAMRWQWHSRIGGFFRNLFQPFAVRLAAAVCYTAGLAYLLLMPPHFSRLEGWSPDYPLILGNEATQDRFWKGELFSAAVYPKALSGHDAVELFQNPDGPGLRSMRRKLGAVVCLDFEEGQGDTIHDIGGSGFPLNVAGRDIHWLPAGKGIRIDRRTGSLLESGPAEKITDAVGPDSRFSVEARFRTLSLQQTGPARIITVSTNPDERNFTLGQEMDALVFRVRTPAAGWNGSRIALVQKNALKDTSIHHIVVSFDHGLVRMVLDGVPLKPLLRADIPYLPVITRLGRNAAARLAFCHLFFFPLGLVWAAVFRKRNMPLTLVVTTLLFCGVALVYWFRFSQPFGFQFFLSALFFSGMGCLFAACFSRGNKFLLF